MWFGYIEFIAALNLDLRIHDLEPPILSPVQNEKALARTTYAFLF